MKCTEIGYLHHLHSCEVRRQHYLYARNIRNRPYRKELIPFLHKLDDRIRKKVWPRGKAYLRVLRKYQ